MNYIKTLVVCIIFCNTLVVNAMQKRSYSVFNQTKKLCAPVIYSEGKKLYLPGPEFKKTFFSLFRK